MNVRWWIAMVVVLGAFIAAGQIVASQATKNETNIDQNRDALITVCATLDTLGFVFEQLQVSDQALAQQPSLAPSVRLQVRNRARLYGTAVEALQQSNPDCQQIE